MDHKLNTELKNENGHSIYPKYVTDKNGERVIVNNPEHEVEVTGELVGGKKEKIKETEENKEKKNKTDW